MVNFIVYKLYINKIHKKDKTETFFLNRDF